MADDKNLNILTDLIARARRAGADSADAIYVQSAALEIRRRLGKAEKLERAESNDLGLRVFVGKKQAVVSSTVMTQAALNEAVERALAMARAAPEDPQAGIADPAELARDFPDLDVCDPTEPTAEQLIARADAAEAAARAVPGVTNSEGAEASWSRSIVALAASNGFAHSYPVSGTSFGVSVLAGKDGDMQRDYDYASKIFVADLPPPEEIGRIAGKRTVARVGSRKVKTTRVPIVFEPRVSGGIVRSLAGAINGQSIARGTSFLKDSLDKPVFGDGISIVDDPFRRRGMRSKPFDGEGIAPMQRRYIDGGRLTGWFLDLASARKLGLRSTGHAARGTSGPPSPAPTNLYMEPGRQTPEQLIGGIKDGFYITEMIGSGVNLITGDFSRGAAGFWIENGKITYPVHEVTVAGNLRDMFKNLTPANDLTFRYGIDAPTLMIEGMTVAGS
jgi:PmbA protein